MGQQEEVPLSIPELFVARGCGKRMVLNAGIWLPWASPRPGRPASLRLDHTH